MEGSQSGNRARYQKGKVYIETIEKLKDFTMKVLNGRAAIFFGRVLFLLRVSWLYGFLLKKAFAKQTACARRRTSNDPCRVLAEAAPAAKARKP